MLVKFSCGCIGFPPEGSGELAEALLLQACDTEHWDFDLMFSKRSFMGGKTFEPLDADAEAVLLCEISKLVSDGHKFRRIQSLLTQ
jgi:hypothetical protein